MTCCLWADHPQTCFYEPITSNHTEQVKALSFKGDVFSRWKQTMQVNKEAAHMRPKLILKILKYSRKYDVC